MRSKVLIYILFIIIIYKLLLNVVEDGKVSQSHSSPQNIFWINSTVNLKTTAYNNTPTTIKPSMNHIVVINNTSSKNISYGQTTCSERSWKRGSGQKVMAFVYYLGKKDKSKLYYRGIKENLNAIQWLYPDWIMRVYHNLPINHPTMKMLKDLESQNNHLDLCDIHNLPGNPVKDASKIYGMIWRFFAMFDPQVDYYASRDLDGIVSERERDAVKEWMQSDFPFHSMRDHPKHLRPIMGGLWDAKSKNSRIQKIFKSAYDKMINDKRSKFNKKIRGPDQYLLQK